jgi:hypothetical protein
MSREKYCASKPYRNDRQKAIMGDDAISVIEGERY